MRIEKLQYITQGTSEAEIVSEVQEALNAGVCWVQLRIKDKTLDFVSIAERVKELCRGRSVFLVNDRVDVAKMVDADGVHLGLEDMAISEARAILGPDKIIGGTANTLEDCLERQESGVDYIGLGPYGMTTTKKKLSPILGLEGYARILPKKGGEIKVPVLAIGGIKRADIALLKMNTNIHGIAVSGLIAQSDKKSQLVAAAMEVLQ